MIINIKKFTEDLDRCTNPKKRISIIDTNYDNAIGWICWTSLKDSSHQYVNVEEMREYSDRIDIVISPEDYDKLAEEIF